MRLYVLLENELECRNLRIVKPKFEGTRVTTHELLLGDLNLHRLTSLRQRIENSARAVFEIILSLVGELGIGRVWLGPEEWSAFDSDGVFCIKEVREDEMLQSKGQAG